MSKYKVSEPSALKFLKANGAVVDENGNVVNDATDYWKKVYDQAEPKVAKYLHSDGTIDENPGSGGGGADLEDNKEVSITENGTVEITPSAGKDGMKKVTANVNVPSGGGGNILPMNINFKGWKVNYDDMGAYVGFLKEGQWVTDKTVLDNYFNQSSDSFVFDPSVFDYCVLMGINTESYPVVYYYPMSNDTSADYDFGNVFSPDFFVTTDSEYPNALFISSNADQEAWVLKNWTTAEYVETLPIVTYTPSN